MRSKFKKSVPFNKAATGSFKSMTYMQGFAGLFALAGGSANLMDGIPENNVVGYIAYGVTAFMAFKCHSNIKNTCKVPSNINDKTAQIKPDLK